MQAPGRHHAVLTLKAAAGRAGGPHQWRADLVSHMGRFHLGGVGQQARRGVGRTARRKTDDQSDRTGLCRYRLGQNRRKAGQSEFDCHEMSPQNFVKHAAYGGFAGRVCCAMQDCQRPTSLSDQS